MVVFSIKHFILLGLLQPTRALSWWEDLSLISADTQSDPVQALFSSLITRDQFDRVHIQDFCPIQVVFLSDAVEDQSYCDQRHLVYRA